MQSYQATRMSGVAWIGKIPSDWKQLRGKFVYGNKKQTNKGLLEPQRLALTLKGVIEREDGDAIGLNPKSLESYQIFETNDLVFKLIDLENKKTSRVGLVPMRGIMSPAYIRLSPRISVCAKYFYYYYYSLYLTYVFNNIAGEGVRANLSSKELLEIPVILPSNEVQERIANYLDEETAKIDNMVFKQERLLLLLSEKRRNTISDSVMGEKCGMTEERFRDICKFNPQTKVDFQPDDVVSFYPMESIGEDGSIDHSQTRRYIEVKTGYSIFQNNDVVMAKVTTCFENYKGAHITEVSSEVGFGTTELFVLRPNSKVEPEYLYWLTQTSEINNYLAGGMRGTGGLKRVVPEEFKNCKVSLPDRNEQREIIKTIHLELAKFDELKQKCQTQIDLLKERRISLISNVVTGKVKV